MRVYRNGFHWLVRESVHFWQIVRSNRHIWITLKEWQSLWSFCQIGNIR